MCLAVIPSFLSQQSALIQRIIFYSIVFEKYPFHFSVLAYPLIPGPAFNNQYLMKRISFSLLVAALCLTGIHACTKDAGDASTKNSIGSSCRYSSAYNADFAKINSNSTYDDLFKIFLAAGDNYQTLATNSDTIACYKWYNCTDSAYFIEVDLEAGLPRMAMKTISDTSCAQNVSESGYDSLQVGMSFAQVQAILGGTGDNFRNDYEMPGNYLKTAYYRFTDCSDTATHIEVRVSPVTGLTDASKTF